MTLQEASSCFHLDIEMLRLYEESGFIRTEKTESGEPDYPEAELRKAAQLYKCNSKNKKSDSEGVPC